MAVTYSGSNNMGPYNPSVNPVPSASQPSTPATPEGTPLNTDNPNTGRTKLAVEVNNSKNQRANH
jgi:hypothetical protein